MIKLWAHQEYAVKWMMERNYGIVNYGMGTGKTALAIEFVRRMNFNRVLIVTTSKGIDVWNKEYSWLGMHEPIDHNHLSTIEQAERLQNISGPITYITSYPRIWRPKLLEALIKKKFDVVLFDESHNIAAHNSKTSLAAKKIAHRCQYRFCLTGTMLTNNPISIFGQARALDPELFNRDDTGLPLLKSFTRFREYFCYLHSLAPGVFIITGYKNMGEYNDALSGFVLRADSDTVLDLPESLHIYRKFSLPSQVKKNYNELKKEAITFIDGEVLSVKNALVRSLRLHQLAGGAAHTDNKETKWVHDEKITQMLEIIEGINEQEPIVIFAKYTHEIDKIHNSINEKVGILSGSINDLEDWQQGKYRILVVQTATGSEAVDLSRAAYTIFYSMEYSLSRYEQALRRTRRPRKDGTKADCVFYYYLIASGTIDEVIIKALQDKSDITQAILKHMETFDNVNSGL